MGFALAILAGQLPAGARRVNDDSLTLEPGDIASISVDHGRCAVVDTGGERVLLSGAVDYKFGPYDAPRSLKVDGPFACRISRMQ
jgi:hypothetical protein